MRRPPRRKVPGNTREEQRDYDEARFHAFLADKETNARNSLFIKQVESALGLPAALSDARELGASVLAAETEPDAVPEPWEDPRTRTVRLFARAKKATTLLTSLKDLTDVE